MGLLLLNYCLRLKFWEDGKRKQFDSIWMEVNTTRINVFELCFKHNSWAELLGAVLFFSSRTNKTIALLINIEWMKLIALVAQKEDDALFLFWYIHPLTWFPLVFLVRLWLCLRLVVPGCSCHCFNATYKMYFVDDLFVRIYLPGFCNIKDKYNCDYSLQNE